MYSKKALDEITKLVKRGDFLSISYIEGRFVTLFFNDRVCNVSNDGVVTWG